MEVVQIWVNHRSDKWALVDHCRTHRLPFCWSQNGADCNPHYVDCDNPNVLWWQETPSAQQINYISHNSGTPPPGGYKYTVCLFPSSPLLFLSLAAALCESELAIVVTCTDGLPYCAWFNRFPRMPQGWGSILWKPPRQSWCPSVFFGWNCRKNERTTSVTR